MLSFSSIMIGTQNPKVLAEFYEKVFDKKPDMEDGSWYGWQIGSTYLTIGEHSEVKGEAKEPQRIIFNLETSEVNQEFERIKDLGAKIIAKPYDLDGGTVATFADPDNNYFQLMTPWKN